MPLLILFVLFLSFSVDAYAISLDACKEVSSKLNKSLPHRKDKFTVIRETGCIPGSPKNRLVYILEVDAPKELVKNIDFEKGIKPDVLRTWCSDPEIRVVLIALDVDHRYYAIDGQYIGKFSMKLSECKPN